MEAGLEKEWSKLKLIEEELESVGFDKISSNKGNGDERNWMVGKLMTQRSFNNDVMINTLRLIWRTAKEVQISVLDNNLFLFKFANKHDKHGIMDGSPWTFDKHLLALEDYNGELRPSEYRFVKAPFWIRIYDLPLGVMKKEFAEKLGARVGTLRQIDPNIDKRVWKSYMRLRVEIDIRKPLTRMVSIKRMNGSSDIRGRIGYERLPIFCYQCGTLGHAEYECGDKATEEVTNEAIVQYGEWLRASPLRKGPFQNHNGRPSERRSGGRTAPEKVKDSGSSKQGNEGTDSSETNKIPVTQPTEK